MREPTATSRQSAQPVAMPSAQLPVPGSRAAVMEAQAAALRAAAADMEDPRTSPVSLAAGKSSRDAMEVASWLRRRAKIIEPPPASAWQRNKVAVLETRCPELPAPARAAAAECFAQVAAALHRFDLDALVLAPQLLEQLAHTFAERMDVPA